MRRATLFSRNVEDSVVLTLFDIANVLGRLGDELSCRAGLTTQQWLLLLQIAGDPNFATPKDQPRRDGEGVMASEIARARGVSRASVSMLVSQLLRRGLVRQEAQSGDRRRKQLTVTSTGRRALAEVDTARRRANESLFAGLTPAERRRLLQSLRACLERLWLADRARGPGPDPVAPAGRRRS
jgi:DNA-binding MarR family transcriptional regulator